VQRIRLATVDIGRVGRLEARAADPADPAHRRHRHRELGFADPYEHRLGHRQGLWQAQGEGRALAAGGADFQGTAKLAHFVVDHVHAHATAGQLADFLGR